MSILYKTTLEPTKLGLLASWFPQQPWYDHGTRESGSAVGELGHAAGGFRLDDPNGEVGCEFLIVRDTESGAAYFAPLTYRSAPLDGAEDRLITTAEHGVLGKRWIYDGTGDPVLLGQLLAFLRGEITADAQNEQDALDESVTSSLPVGISLTGAEITRSGSNEHGTDIAVDAGANGRCTLRVHHDLATAPRDDDRPGVRTSWEADGEEKRGVVISAHLA